MVGFSSSLQEVDPDINSCVKQELERQQNVIELIASENYTSSAVMEAQGSYLTNKYAEGYPGKRYYNGCDYVDIAETLAIERAKKLFNCNFANVQPHSGSQANQAVFLALLDPKVNNRILSLSLDCGGHLTHGSPVNMSGKLFDIKHYGVDKNTGLVDYEEIKNLTNEFKPNLIIAGFSAYSRDLDFAKFREIADSVGAWLLVDMAHIAGLVGAGCIDSPLPHAHVVTSTTHKTLRGPRGGIILAQDASIKVSEKETLEKALNMAVFPGLQGGPLMHVIAAKAVAFKEALSDDFKIYAKNVINNAQVLAQSLQSSGVDLLTGGTDNHIIVIDLSSLNITGKDVSNALEEVGITCNKNTIPFDKKSPFVTSGVRIGTAACTTRNFGESEFKMVGDWISQIIHAIANDKFSVELKESISSEVQKLCKLFPIYK